MCICHPLTKTLLKNKLSLSISPRYSFKCIPDQIYPMQQKRRTSLPDEEVVRGAVSPPKRLQLQQEGTGVIHTHIRHEAADVQHPSPAASCSYTDTSHVQSTAKAD